MSLDRLDPYPYQYDVIDPDDRNSDDEAVVAMEAEANFAMRVTRAADDLRVREAARRKIAAEAEASTDFDALYLDRGQVRTLRRADPLISGVLPRNAYGVLRGRDHSFKSFVALDWACCLATGKPWQGHPTQRTKVLYIAGEGAYGIAARLDAWEDAWGVEVDPEWLTVRIVPLNLYAPGAAFDDLLERVEDGGYGLVVVDTLRRVSGQAEGNGSDMGVVVDNLALIKQATDEGTVLAVTHTDKGDNDSRGYSGIEDDADVVWHAKRDEQMLALSLTKMKDGPDGTTVNLEATPSLNSMVLKSSSGKPVSTAQSQIRLLDTMRELFRDGVTGNELQAACLLSRSTYYRALAAVKDAGHLVNEGTDQRPFFRLTGSGESQGPWDGESQ